MRLAFTKMHGAGNDFVVIDHRVPFLPADPTALFARLCDRRRGIGADGVLLLELADGHDFAMRYHNADGGRASFCGNGARCLVRFALGLGLGRAGEVAFVTDAGEKRGRLGEGGLVTLEFGPVDAGAPRQLESGGRVFEGRYVVAGVPHFVVPVGAVGLPGVGDVPLLEWAPPLRGHAELGVEGANVDFVAPLGPSTLAMRTYERGVEGETLACGSGAIACALWAVETGIPGPITVRTAGGDDLRVAFTAMPGGRTATLTGPAEVSFTGAWDG